MLLQKRNYKSNCVNTFDFYSSSIMAVSNTFKQSNVNGYCFFGQFNIVVKSVIFFNEGKGTFTRVSSVQDEQVILK